MAYIIILLDSNKIFWRIRKAGGHGRGTDVMSECSQAELGNNALRSDRSAVGLYFSFNVRLNSGSSEWSNQLWLERLASKTHKQERLRFLPEY